MRIQVAVLPQAGFTEGPTDLRGRSRHGASDRRILGRTSRRLRKKIEKLFAHLKRILNKLDRLRLRGPNGARDEFILAATDQNLRKMAKLIPMPA
jgi:Transposase DDE domain